MARLPRVTQKLFGSSAGFQQVGQFGSLAANSPTYTTDAAQIQGLSNFLDGWFAAVLGNNSPAIQDMNGLFLVAFQQLAYLMQEGVAEWDTATTYYTGNIVSDGAGQLYVSLQDSNISHTPISSPTYWRNYNQSAGHVPIGAVVPTFPNLTGAYVCAATTVADYAGYVLCQGQTLVDATSPMNGQVIPNLTGSVFLQGTSAAGSTGGAASVTLVSGNLPSHAHSIPSLTVPAAGLTIGAGTLGLSGNTGNTHISHDHAGSGLTFNFVSGQAVGTPTFFGSGGSLTSPQPFAGGNLAGSFGVGQLISTITGVSGTIGGTTQLADPLHNHDMSGVSITGSPSLAGSASSNASTTGSIGSGTAFSIVPPFVTTVYCMRVK